MALCIHANDNDFMKPAIPESMRAMLLRRIASLADNDSPLEPGELPTPEPAAGELLVRVRTCGVCHTELDEIEGRTAPAFLPIVLGHQVVGDIVATGRDVSTRVPGERVGIGWIYCSCGGPHENLSDEFRATGRDAHGGYAEFMVVPESYAHPIPASFSDEEAAPLLCAGSVGYRALKLSGMEKDKHLGLTGFGGSGHLVLQLARHLYPGSTIAVFARSPVQRRFAMALGADWSGDIEDEPPELLDAIIDTTPAWQPLVSSLAHLRPGGRLVVNAIRKESADIDALLGLDYGRHLWMEKELKSVANVTAADIREFVRIAADIPLRPHTRLFALADANAAINALRDGSLQGSLVLKITNNQ